MRPQDVMSVIFVEGTDYEMGYQYAAQLAEYFPSACRNAWVRAHKLGDPRHPVASSREAVLKDVQAYKELLARYMPEQLEQIRGMVDALAKTGEGVEEADLLLIQSGINRRTAAEASARKAEELQGGGKACCAWSAWGKTTQGGKLICADSSDGDFTPQVCLIAFPREGSPYVSTAAIGELSDHFSYSFGGLFFGDSGGNGRRLVDWGYGLRWTSVLQHCVRFASGVKEAQSMISSWPHALPENYHLVDKSRTALVVELTADLQSVRRPGDCGEDDFLYSTNNFVSDKMRPACDPDGTAKYVQYGGWPGNAGVPRNLEIRQLLTRYAGLVDLEFAKMMWRFPGSPPPAPPGTGWSNMICRMSNSRVALVLPDEGPFGEIYVCTGPVGRVIYQFRRSTFPIQPTHRFVHIPLRESAEEIVDALYGLGCDDLASSHHELSRLSVKHPGYFGLRDIQTEAHTHLYEGKEAYYKGLMVSSSGRLGWLSTSATELARAQAHSGELRELIVPPPTSPDQMGLDPWVQEYRADAEYRVGLRP